MMNWRADFNINSFFYEYTLEYFRWVDSNAQLRHEPLNDWFSGMVITHRAVFAVHCGMRDIDVSLPET